MEELIKKGFVIYPKGTEFALQKVSTPFSPEKLEEKTFSSHQDAVDFAESFGQNKLRTFSGIVRYNRKLGIEYKNLPIIEANNMEEAHEKALLLAQKIVGEQYIIEVKVRLKND